MNQYAIPLLLLAACQPTSVKIDDQTLSDTPPSDTSPTDEPDTADTDDTDDSDDTDDTGSDSDGIDSDGDGISDEDEIEQGTDPNNPDSDGDGLSDGEELNLGTDPNNPDTDGDGLSDGEEVSLGTDPTSEDTDGDGLLDNQEISETQTDPTNADSDGDGLSDSEELNIGTDPNNSDTDGDGVNDGQEVNTYQTDPHNTDTDSDGLSDGEEINTHGTNPNNPDTDGDGLSDESEINTYGTNPINADTDDGGADDSYEIFDGTDPNDPNDDDPNTSEGLLGGHFDADTSSFISPIGNGSTDKHIHEYDDDYQVTGVDFFNMFNSGLHTIDTDITDPDQPFRLIVLNANLSVSGRLTINNTYDPLDYATWQPITIYDNTTDSNLPIYSLSGANGTTQLSQAGIYFHPLAIVNGGLHPSKTGCVKDNELGPNDEWRNGAVTIQAISVNPDGSPAYTLDGSMSNGGHGAAASGLLWELTLFWHWNGPCYHENGWSTYTP